MRMPLNDAPRGKTHIWLRNNVLGLVAIFIALSGTAVATQTADTSGDNASQAAKKKKAKAKKGPPGPQGPQGQQGPPGPSTGPAGGDLTGTYPNPTIGADKVTGDKIPDNTLTGAEIAPDSLASEDLALDSVGSSELKANRAATATGTATNGTTPVDSVVSCDANEALVGGGYAFANPSAGDQVQVSAPVQNPPNSVTSWIVTATTTGAADTVFAWAVCLDV